MTTIEYKVKRLMECCPTPELGKSEVCNRLTDVLGEFPDLEVFVPDLVSKWRLDYENVPSTYRSPQVLETLVNVHGLKGLPEEVRSRELCMFAIKKHFEDISFVPEVHLSPELFEEFSKGKKEEDISEMTSTLLGRGIALSDKVYLWILDRTPSLHFLINVNKVSEPVRLRVLELDHKRFTVLEKDLWTPKTVDLFYDLEVGYSCSMIPSGLITREVALKACRRRALDYVEIPEELRDFDLWMDVLKEAPEHYTTFYKLGYPERLTEDQALFLVKSHGPNFPMIPEELWSDEMIREAIKEEPSNIQMVDPEGSRLDLWKIAFESYYEIAAKEGFCNRSQEFLSVTILKAFPKELMISLEFQMMIYRDELRSWLRDGDYIAYCSEQDLDPYDSRSKWRFNNPGCSPAAKVGRLVI